MVVGDIVHLSQIKLPKGVEILNEPDQLVVNIVAPRKEEEPAPAAEGAEGEAEPEVIAKGKKEDEEDAEGEKK